MNCTICIEQRESKNIKLHIYETDDYRIATAIENLLHNMECVTYNDLSHKEARKI
jgi:hypothetical protein